MTSEEYKAKIERAAMRHRKRLVKRRELGFGPQRSTVKAQLNYLWSLAIRRRDRKKFAGLCLVCIASRALGFKTTPPGLIEVAYHIIPRGDESVKWDLDNGVGSCGACNFGELWSRARASSRARRRQIHIYLIGEAKLLELKTRACKPSELATADLIELREKFKSIVEGKK